jgi:hypothetical protein
LQLPSRLLSCCWRKRQIILLSRLRGVSFAALKFSNAHNSSL